MNKVALLVILGVLLCAVPQAEGFFSFGASGLGDMYGGSNCAGCTILVGLSYQLADIHNKTLQQVLDDVCGWFPSTLSPICDYFVNKYETTIVSLWEQEQTPDVVCYHLKFCTNQTCRLWPAPKKELDESFSLPPSRSSAPTLVNHRISVLTQEMKDEGRMRAEGETPWAWLEVLMNKVFEYHQPLEDFDHDNFSDASTLRGWSWKGRDCNDFDAKYRPGVIPTNHTEIDYNCNGIKGYDGSRNMAWQHELCADSRPMGVAVVGDSFGAHFSIPPAYMNASEINEHTYDDLLPCIENEFDWPERSAFTAFETNITGVMIDSFYLRMRERNLCNHRDYQNVGVNGCRSGSLRDNVIKSLVRHQTEDYPLLLVFELIGNDVCSPHHDLDRFTTPEDFFQNVVATLQYLDEEVLPAGSHIMFLGLADGRTLWDSLHDRLHPIGVPYVDVYNFLNCLEISPCWGWMNENETIRNLTSERAALLSTMYPQIIANYTFQNFDMAYYDFPFDAINKEWIAMGGETWQLIEPVDGFHPNQIAHYLISRYLWSELENDHPDWLGSINPNNPTIAKMFGDQGGY